MFLDSVAERQAREAEIQRLTDIIVALKRQNYSPPDVLGKPVVLEPLSAVQKAIYGLPKKVQGGVRSAVEEWERQGLSEPQILRRIELGEDEYGVAS
jgi:hypothetical protein